MGASTVFYNIQANLWLVLIIYLYASSVLPNLSFRNKDYNWRHYHPLDQRDDPDTGRQ
jgi:hypothetical protein